MSDLKTSIVPVQEALTVAGFQLRQARNKAEALALSLPAELAAGLNAEVDSLGKIISRVDAVGNHLRKMTAEPKAVAEPAKKGSAK